MAIFKNYYQLLGVEPFAEPEAVKAAFRKLARQHHPDLNGGHAKAEEKFKEINEAYDILSNPEKRAMHDATLRAMQGIGQAGKKQAYSTAKGETPPDKSPNASGASTKNREADNNPSKNTGNPATQGAGGPKDAEKEARPGKSNTTPINELFESFLKKGFSDGSGKADPEEGVFRNRKDSGKAQEKPRRGEDVVVKTVIAFQEASEGVVKTVNVQHNEICRRCSGTGKVNGSVCSACNGEKILVRHKKIDVRIPAGVKTGSRVRVAKEGGRGSGGADNGDLFLQIELSMDASLRIEGVDVHGEVAISVTDAVLGGEIEVPTLNGTVTMTIPAGTQAGRVFRLKERGVQAGLTKGDHLVTVTVQMPENLTSREKELYQELARLRPEKPGVKKSR